VQIQFQSSRKLYKYNIITSYFEQWNMFDANFQAFCATFRTKYLVKFLWKSCTNPRNHRTDISAQAYLKPSEKGKENVAELFLPYKIVFILYYLTFRINMYLISIIKPLQLKITVFSKNIFYQNRKVSGHLVKLYQIEIFVRTFEKLSGRLRNCQDVWETVRTFVVRTFKYVVYMIFFIKFIKKRNFIVLHNLCMQIDMQNALKHLFNFIWSTDIIL
jgi:hypothetical protein